MSENGTYYQRNKERLQVKARSCSYQQGKEKAIDYCKNNKERLQEQA